MPYFNTSNLSNITSFPGLINYGNTITGGYLSAFLIVAVWIISFMAFGLYAKEDGILAASTITLIAAVLMFAGGIGSWMAVAVAIAAVLVSGLILYLRR
jgi:hypothetical protein